MIFLNAYSIISARDHKCLAYIITTTAANAHDITQAQSLLHGQEEAVFADSVYYLYVEKFQEIQDKQAGLDWEIAITLGRSKSLDKTKASYALNDRIEKIKASICTNMGHLFQVIKCQIGHRKTRYRGLAKNTSQLLMVFARSNWWMERKRMIPGIHASVSPSHRQGPKQAQMGKKSRKSEKDSLPVSVLEQ